MPILSFPSKPLHRATKGNVNRVFHAGAESCCQAGNALFTDNQCYIWVLHLGATQGKVGMVSRQRSCMPVGDWRLANGMIVQFSVRIMSLTRLTSTDCTRAFVLHEKAVTALIIKLGPPVHEVIECVLVPIVIICQQSLVPFLRYSVYKLSIDIVT